MPKPNQKPTYEKLKTELDTVLAELQRDDLDVDKALEYYQRGLELIKQLEKYLGSAENKVHQLKAAFDSGDAKAP